LNQFLVAGGCRSKQEPVNPALNQLVEVLQLDPRIVV
jgi:hypothetical protein